MKADVLLVNGRCLTFAGRSARSLATIGDRIVAVGAEDELSSLRGPRTRVLDLQGGLALPGFIDSHVHLRALAARLTRLRLESAPSLQEALRRIDMFARRTPPGVWITGGGFDKNVWGQRFPTRYDLDSVTQEHPVALRSRDGHTLWLNSLALAKVSLARSTPDPPGGAIGRDERGELTGILQEAATGLVRRSPAFDQPQPTLDHIRAALRFLLRQGLTSVHLMEEAPILQALQELRREEGLPIRTTVYRDLSALDDLIAADITSGLGDEWVRIGGLKLMLDGTLGSQTAWLFEPYENGPSGDLGISYMSVEELRNHVRCAAKAGLACAIHAIGDRANAEALDAVEAAQHLATPLPHRIEHCQLLRRRDVARFARLRVIASMQPCHMLGDIDISERYWGRRSRWAFPVRSLLSRKATLAFGSDAPVETANPLAGIYAAVLRQTLDGRPSGGWNRDLEGIRIVQAIRSYTLGPAFATGEAHLKGRLAPGYLADIVVFPRDLTRLRSRALLELKPDLVIVGGRVRYRRPPAARSHYV
jgi:predicted amidohydrolase YtcJ